MATENLVSIQLSSEELQRAKDAINELKSVLEPMLVTLSAQDRQRFPKMGDGTEPFVEKALDYAEQDPTFMPPYVKAEDMRVDFQAVKDLNSLYRPLLQLVQQLDDSILLSGSEAYTAALAYYNSVKLASRLNVAGSKSIYNDLRGRFERSASNGSNGNGSNGQ